MGQSSESFDEHERPTAQRSRPEGPPERDEDPNATTRIKPFDLEQLVAKGSGTRPVVTSEQIDRYKKEKADERERETLDALTLQRETLIIEAPKNIQNIVASTPQPIPIDVDLSRLDERRARFDRRHVTIGAFFFVAMISALLGFIAGRL